MQFSPTQKFPLNFIAWFQADGGGQGQGKAHIEPGVLAFGSDGLNTQWISGLHFF